jgi:hypothetical protein
VVGLCLFVTLLAAGEAGRPRASAQATASRISIEAADRFDDGIAAVNAPLCRNPSAFGPLQDANGRAELAYLSGYNFRHIRDSFSTCFHQVQFDDAWRDLAAGGAGLLVTELFSYTDSDLRTARQRNPGVEGFTAGNEWDVENVDEVLGKTAAPGDMTIVTRPFGVALHMVPGQTYSFVDEKPESFTVAKPLSHDSASLVTSLRSAHRAGTKLIRDGDFVSDINNWLAYYEPRLRLLRPRVPILGASLAFSIHSEAFSVPTDRKDGHFNLDAVEEHGYPAPMGSNPEGPAGDGKSGYIRVDHPPCSYARTSYSMWFNACEAERQTGVTSLAIWDTEYSYQVVPNGASSLSSAPHAIPDDVSILYLARSEFFAAAHGRTRLYWFQMLDGTSGPNSGFCSYGLIYTGKCGEESAVTEPMPKGELFALGDLIRFFRDESCKYPGCTWSPGDLVFRWSDPSLPLNTSAFGWKSGKVAIVAWLGSKSYDFAGTACAATSACYVKVPPRSEYLSSPILKGRSVSERSFDTNPADPMPPQISVKSPDGSLQSIAACRPELRKKFYGCLTPSQKVRVIDDTIFLQVTDDPVILTVEPPVRR